MLIREQEILDALRGVVDPEVGMNVVDLGLIYRVDIDDARVEVTMTATTPACPMGAYLKDQVEATIRQRVPGAASVEVKLVWDPPWTPEKMSAGARRQLGWDDE